MQNASNVIAKLLSEDGCNYANIICVCVKGCTNGLETKNQTLAHNVLISGLDGDPSCGGYIP